MWLLIGVCASVLVLALIGDTYPRLSNYSPPSSYQPLPDLRVSEFAPDLKAAITAEGNWILSIPSRQKEIKHREKVEYIKAKLEKEESRTERRNRNIREQQARQKQDYLRYHDEILEIKARRMKEGNPVTKKNPIDPEDMPREPYRPLFHF